MDRWSSSTCEWRKHVHIDRHLLDCGKRCSVERPLSGIPRLWPWFLCEFSRNALRHCHRPVRERGTNNSCSISIWRLRGYFHRWILWWPLQWTINQHQIDETVAINRGKNSMLLVVAIPSVTPVLERQSFPTILMCSTKSFGGHWLNGKKKKVKNWFIQCNLNLSSYHIVLTCASIHSDIQSQQHNWCDKQLHFRFWLVESNWIE